MERRGATSFAGVEPHRTHRLYSIIRKPVLRSPGRGLSIRLPHGISSPAWTFRTESHDPMNRLHRALLAGIVLLAGCSSSPPAPESPVERCHTSIRMKKLVTYLPPGYWEGSAERYLQRRYPRGVPEDYVAIDAEGAQASLQALRLDGATLAVIQGPGASLHAGMPGARTPTSGFRVLRRMDCGWLELTARVLPPRVSPGSVSRMNQDGTVFVSTRTGNMAMRFDGTRFIPIAGQNTAGH